MKGTASLKIGVSHTATLGLSHTGTLGLSHTAKVVHKRPKKSEGASMNGCSLACVCQVLVDARLCVFLCSGPEGAFPYERPSISPFTMSMRSACGDFDSPGMRMMSPAMATIISEPELMTRSRMWTLKPVGHP